MSALFVSLRLFVFMTVLTGLLYPVFILLVGQVAFHYQANGSMLQSQSKVIGSELIAQKFTSDRYFWPRPSTNDYNGLASGGSNLGPTSAILQKQVRERTSLLKKTDGDVPSELVYASGSGLDPHLSPEGALFQADRVARARGMDVEKLKTLIADHVQRGFALREPIINVLLLNQALDQSAHE